MLTKAFLSPAEIEERIAQEAASDKDRKLTPEQIEAIYSNGTNILVSASAGSGKTFVMVERILDMIGRGVGIDQLFISTFTVKAAGELKERLEKRLTKHLGQAETDEERAFLSDQIAKIGRLILEPWMPLPRNWSISMAISWVCHLLSVS